LAKYLHESSLDVIRNGHSKLNAGSEHKLYYAIQEQQRYAKAQVTHGILVSIGTLITTKLFQQESGDPTLYNAMRTAHKRLDLPLSYEDLRMLGIERAHIVRSLDKLGTDDTWLYGRFHTSVRNSLMDEVFA
jgi:glycerol dehydrogenase-like iron-containing ADH family enzyme